MRWPSSDRVRLSGLSCVKKLRVLKLLRKEKTGDIDFNTIENCSNDSEISLNSWNLVVRAPAMACGVVRDIFPN